MREKVRGGKLVGDRLRRVFDAILKGDFGNLSDMHGFCKNILNGNDYYLVTVDFYEYAEA